MRLKRKIPSFVFGLSIGLLIGAAFFLFKLDSIFSNLRSAAGNNKITVIEQKLTETESKARQKDRERFKIKTIETTNESTSEEYREADSLINTPSEKLTIAIDELLSARTIKIISLSETESSDSLSGKLAGVNHHALPDAYLVEFWKTPLNSKGYRFHKNKIMLYGLTDHSNIMLYQLEGKFFVKSFEIVYELKTNQDFQPFVKVNNNELLAKINS